jgi:acetyl-CoA acyltransferase
MTGRNPDVDWARVDDVVRGRASQAGEDNRNMARVSALLAGLAVEVSGTTVNRLCASGLDAVGFAAPTVIADDARLIIAGGVESMSRAPFVQPKTQTPYARSALIYDTTIGWRFLSPVMQEQYGTDGMPQTAQSVADDYDGLQPIARIISMASAGVQRRHAAPGHGHRPGSGGEPAA